MAEEKLGVVGQHRKRLADDPEYRAAALTAPSITDKRGIHEKVLPRTVPTALSGAKNAVDSFDVEGATKDELIGYADEHGITVKKSAKVDEIRDAVRAGQA